MMGMMKISPERIRELLIYNSETGAFTRRKKTGRRWCVGQNVGWQIAEGRWILSLDGVKIRRARAAWLYVYGEWPEEDIDHINRDCTDDRICNLRKATRQQNMANKTIHKNNACGLKGVYFHKQARKWRAVIRFNRKTNHIGLFKTKEEAHQAYLKAAQNVFGEFATSGSRLVK